MITNQICWTHSRKGLERSSSSDFILVTTRTKLLISDRKSNVSFLHSYTIRVESDYDWSGCICWNAEIKNKIKNVFFFLILTIHMNTVVRVYQLIYSFIFETYTFFKFISVNSNNSMWLKYIHTITSRRIPYNLIPHTANKYTFKR